MWPPWSKDKQKHAESARDVRREYAAHIEKFLEEFDPRFLPSWPGQHKRSLPELLQFARDTHQAKHRLQAQVADLEAKLKSANSQISVLQDDLASTCQNLDDCSAALRQHKKDLASANDRWGEILADANNQHELEAVERESLHAAVVVELRGRIDGLIGEIMHNQPADSRAWTDEKLKGRMGDLNRQLSEITKPEHHQGLDGAMVSKFDTDGFVARGGADGLSFLLRSKLWDILEEYFFSSPLGFGSLGQSEGKEALLGIFKAWWVLVDTSEVEGVQAPSITVFEKDPEANKWRSSTFESLMASVLQDDRSLRTTTASPPSASRLLWLYNTNIKQAAARMEKVLAEVAGSTSPGSTKSRRELVLKAARLGAELGLQLGVQSARVELTRPSRRQLVVLGDEFHHCVNGDLDRGQRVRVDLVVSPGLARLGSAKTDERPVVLVQCNIYPYPT